MRLDGSKVVKGFEDVNTLRERKLQQPFSFGREASATEEMKSASLAPWVERLQESLPRYAEQVLASVENPKVREYAAKFTEMSLPRLTVSDLRIIFDEVTARDRHLPFNKRDQLSQDITIAQIENAVRTVPRENLEWVLVEYAMQARMSLAEVWKLKQRIYPEPTDSGDALIQNVKHALRIVEEII